MTDRKRLNSVQKRQHKFSFSDVERDKEVINGVSFMKVMINKADQTRVAGAPGDVKHQDEDGKDLIIKFKWQENGDLLIDNSNTALRKVEARKSATPGIAFRNYTLAVRMGWIQWQPPIDGF